MAGALSIFRTTYVLVRSGGLVKLTKFTLKRENLFLYGLQIYLLCRGYLSDVSNPLWKWVELTATIFYVFQKIIIY
jgi:hypothetical protein